MEVLLEKINNGDTCVASEINNEIFGDEAAHLIGEALKENTTLTTLDMSWNSIGPGGIRFVGEALKKNTTLTALDLSWNIVGADETACFIGKMMKENTTLITLNLTGNGIGPDGACFLGEMLKENTTLTTLNLSYNNLLATGTRFIGEALKDNTTLTTLHLTANNIGPVGVRFVTEALKENTTLTNLHIDCFPDPSDYIKNAMRSGMHLNFTVSVYFYGVATPINFEYGTWYSMYPHVRHVLRTRALVVQGRAYSIVNEKKVVSVYQWLHRTAPMWVTVQVCAYMASIV
jgi:hypothetical protein